MLDLGFIPWVLEPKESIKKFVGYEIRAKGNFSFDFWCIVYR